ncbi:MAG: hypothetical protein M1281_13375 [Chloroflexi bacterium]|nr:hypothetical protein [Chloroflexota bacterium]
MKKSSQFFLLLAIVLGIWQWALLFVGGSWYYTVTNLERARKNGVYASPEAGIRAIIAKSYLGIQKIEIEHAGTNSFDGSNPHVGFAIARVWADRRSDGTLLPVSGDFPGSFFLQMKDGWVHVGEGYFPEFIGFWMKIFGMAGG